MNDKPLSNQRLRLSLLVLVELRRFLALSRTTSDPPSRLSYRKSGKVGHREDFALLRIDPELVDINTVVLVPMLPSTDMDPGH